nr:type II toxin-antitoxin system RelE/ParE family toxin [Paraburkholderia caballeronis]
MRVGWSARALAERDAIFDFAEAESPRAAELIDERIADQIRLLARFPQLGRLGRGRRHAGTGDLRDAVHRRLPDCGR